MKPNNSPDIPGLLLRLLNTEEFQKMASYRQNRIDEILSRYEIKEFSSGPTAPFRPFRGRGGEKTLPAADVAQNGPGTSPGKPCKNQGVIPPEMQALGEKMRSKLEEDIPKRSRLLFLSLMLHVADDKDVPATVCPGEIRDEILRECGWVDKGALYRGLKILCECLAIRKIGHGKYEISPQYENLIVEVKNLKAEGQKSLTGEQRSEAAMDEQGEGFLPGNNAASIAESEIMGGRDISEEITRSNEEAPQKAPECVPGIPEQWQPLLSILRRLAGDGRVAHIGDGEGSFLGCKNKADLYRGLDALREYGVIRALGRGEFLLLDTPGANSLESIEENRPQTEEIPVSKEVPAKTKAEAAVGSHIGPLNSGSESNEFPSVADYLKKESCVSKETSDKASPNSVAVLGVENTLPKGGMPHAEEISEGKAGNDLSSYKKLFSVLCKRAGNDGVVQTGGSLAQEITDECGWKNKASLYAGFVSLCKCGAIKQLKRGEYQINSSFRSGFSASTPAYTEPALEGATLKKAARLQPETEGESNPTEFKPRQPIPMRWKPFFLALCRKAGNNGLVHTGGATGCALAIECGWKGKSSIFAGLKALCDYGALKQLEKGFYQINPELLRTEPAARQKLDTVTFGSSFAEKLGQNAWAAPSKSRLTTNQSTSIPKEAAFKQSVLKALREYREENGLGCLNPLSKKAAVPVEKIRMMMESSKVDYSVWVKVGKALGVKERE